MVLNYNEAFHMYREGLNLFLGRSPVPPQKKSSLSKRKLSMRSQLSPSPPQVLKIDLIKRFTYGKNIYSLRLVKEYLDIDA